MLPLGGNYKKDWRFAQNNWQCPGCVREDGEGVSDDQDHVSSSCPAYSDLRALYDLDSEQGLLLFFRAVLARRRRERE